MDEKEAEARPVMGTIFLVRLNWVQARTRAPMGVCHSPLKMGKVRQRQTNLPERSHHPGRTSFFQNVRLGRKASFQDITNTLGFQSGLFFTTMRLRTQLSASLA